MEYIVNNKHFKLKKNKQKQLFLYLIIKHFKEFMEESQFKDFVEIVDKYLPNYTFDSLIDDVKIDNKLIQEIVKTFPKTELLLLTVSNSSYYNDSIFTYFPNITLISEGGLTVPLGDMVVEYTLNLTPLNLFLSKVYSSQLKRKNSHPHVSSASNFCLSPEFKTNPMYGFLNMRGFLEWESLTGVPYVNSQELYYGYSLKLEIWINDYLTSHSFLNTKECVKNLYNFCMNKFYNDVDTNNKSFRVGGIYYSYNKITKHNKIFEYGYPEIVKSKTFLTEEEFLNRTHHSALEILERVEHDKVKNFDIKHYGQ